MHLQVRLIPRPETDGPGDGFIDSGEDPGTHPGKDGAAQGAGLGDLRADARPAHDVGAQLQPGIGLGAAAGRAKLINGNAHCVEGVHTDLQGEDVTFQNPFEDFAP